MSTPSKLVRNHPVLLIEADDHYAQRIEVLLSESDIVNCSLIHCSSLLTGLDILALGAIPVAAIIVDVSLPDSEGLDTLERLLSQHPKMSIIVVTGPNNKILSLAAMKAGAQDFLLKGSFEPLELTKTLKYCIERSSALLQLEETQQLANIGQWACSPVEQIFSTSEELLHIFGFDRHQVIDYDTLLDPSSPLHVFLGLQGRAKTQGKAQDDRWITRLDGEQRFLSFVCRASHTEQGHYLFNGIVQDITARRQADELRRARDIAEHTASIRENLVANISHEMRTPMNAVLGMSNLLLTTPLNEEQQGHVAAIKQSSEVMLGIIGDILDISALKKDKIVFKPAPFTVQRLLEDTVRLMMPSAEEKGLRVVLSLSDKLPERLVGDSLRLNQVLYNLLGNAIKFTDKGYITLRVGIQEASPDTVGLQFEVSDTGIGIGADHIDDIFAPFARGKHGERLYEGTGLGLSIVKSLIEQQGGHITVKSKIGEGTTFRFVLPFQRPTHGQKEKDGIDNPTLDLPRDSSFRLLLVEDHKMNMLVARRTLEKHWPHLQLHIANDGEEAIERLAETPVDIILMDIQMPKRDGFSATEYIRQRLPAPACDTPVVAMTAHANIIDHEKYHTAGFDGYILKPFSPEQLFAAIAQHVKLQE